MMLNGKILISNLSLKGFSHDKCEKPCQDHSLSYKDSKRVILAVADGHGGDKYIRSEFGSKFACEAIKNTFLELSDKNIYKVIIDKLYYSSLVNRIKMLLLDKWSSCVQDHLKENPISKDELSKLNKENRNTIKNNPTQAYGTTLLSTMYLEYKYKLLFTKKILITLAIGDGEIIYQKDNRFHKAFADLETDPVGNITYSLCQKDAADYINVSIKEVKNISSIFLCSDGLINPYNDYDSFLNSFLISNIGYISKYNNFIKINDIINVIATTKGYGDDVSYAVGIIK